MLDHEGRNFYEILGVGRSASTEEISQAYRQRISTSELAVTKGEPEADGIQIIKAITEAYRILTDEVKRREYDSQLPGASEARPRKGTQVIEDLSLNFESAPQPARSHDELSQVVAVAERIRTSSNVIYDLAQAASPGKVAEIPEEWVKEREFFEEHFDEIFKPVPKVDLVGAKTAQAYAKGSAVSLADWDDVRATGLTATRFGTLPRSGERVAARTVPLARREIVHRPFRDPFVVLTYLGLPLMAILVAVEIYLYNR